MKPRFKRPYISNKFKFTLIDLRQEIESGSVSPSKIKIAKIAPPDTRGQTYISSSTLEA